MREEELFGKIYLIVTYDSTNESLKVRLKKLKCYSREYFQSGLYVRHELQKLYGKIVEAAAINKDLSTIGLGCI